MTILPMKSFCIRCGKLVPFGSLLCVDCLIEKIKRDIEWFRDP